MIAPGALHYDFCFTIKGYKVMGEIMKILGIVRYVKWLMNNDTAWLQDSDRASAF